MVVKSIIFKGETIKTLIQLSVVKWWTELQVKKSLTNDIVDNRDNREAVSFLACHKASRFSLVFMYVDLPEPSFR